MIHLRRDYDKIQDESGKIDMAEPVFLLRGQDPLAGPTVKHWVDLYVERIKWLSASANPPNDFAFLQTVKDWADFMSAYAEARDHGLPTIDPKTLRTELLQGLKK